MCGIYYRGLCAPIINLAVFNTNYSAALKQSDDKAECVCVKGGDGKLICSPRAVILTVPKINLLLSSRTE